MYVCMYVYISVSVISSRCQKTRGVEYSYIEYMRDFI